MAVQRVTFRKMTPVEYRSATEHREAESVRVLSGVMPEELALERVRSGTARFFPAARHVFSSHRRLGYGFAVLSAAEALITGARRTALGLSVVGDNVAAMRKKIQTA